MNKLVGYTILIFGTLTFFLIFGLVQDGMKEIVYEENGLQFEYLSKGKAVTPTVDIQFFSSQDKNELTLYKNEGYRNKGLWTNLSVYKTNDLNENVHTLAVKALKGEIKFQTNINNLDRNAMVDLISSMKDYRGIRLSRYNAESGWFGYVDDTVVIFVLFGLLFFVVCLIINSLVALMSQKFNNKLEWIIPGMLILFLAYYSTLPGFSVWAPFTESMNQIINFSNIFLVFLLLRIIMKKTKNLDFADREVIKFFTIIIGVFVLGYSFSQIGYSIDSSRYFNILMIYNHGPHPMIMGMMIAFAAGNLLANIVRRMIKMRGSEKILKKTELALETSSANLQSLQSTINPHFLYNSLNSIASTAKINGEKTEKMALALSSFYKYITNKKDETITALENEVEMLNNYLEIEKIRFGDNLLVEMNFEPSTLDCNLPRLLLQPIVENAIKYGYGDSAITVKIKGTKIENKLILKIYDSGALFAEDMQIGYGLKSVLQKLEALYPDQYILEFKNLPTKHILIVIDQNEVR